MADLTMSDKLAQMLNKTLYVAIRSPLNVERLDELLSAHLTWAIATEKAGQLFASGPFVDLTAAPGMAGGMSIVRAGSKDEAISILNTDPFVAEGVFSIEVRKWMLMEGLLTVSVSFSDQHCKVL